MPARKRWWRGPAVRCALTALPLAALCAACGVFDAPPDAPRAAAVAGPTLLANGSFDAGAEPWVAATSGNGTFAVAEGEGRNGGVAAELRLASGEAGSTGVAGVRQSIATTPAFPEFVSGYYRVASWKPQAPFQYLAFIVTVHGGDFGDELTVHEVRFPIGGIDRDPFSLPEVRYQFLSRGRPVIGQWSYFGYPLHQAFLQKWARVPTRWDSIDVAVQVRYDGGTEGQQPETAVVYYDDVYVGLQPANPNRPPDP